MNSNIILYTTNTGNVNVQAQYSRLSYSKTSNNSND